MSTVPRSGAIEKEAGDPPAGQTAATAEVLEHALTRVARAILRLRVPSHVLGEGEHIDRSGYWTLVRLDEFADPLRLSDLAALLELDLSTVSRQVRHLVETGLVVRDPDPGDGRACLLSLSPRGQAVLDAMREARCSALSAALGAWANDERITIATALTRLADDLQAPTPPGSAGEVPFRPAAPRPA